MALVRAFEKLEGERQTLHEEVVARYATFQKDDRAFVQINTYGRATRQIPDKVSQSIQLDRDGAQQLVAILKTAFGL
jgi:hypothetical protein